MQLLALARHEHILEDGPEIPGEENTEDDHGDRVPRGLSPQAQRIEQPKPEHQQS
jgi:hypothetical protein